MGGGGASVKGVGGMGGRGGGDLEKGVKKANR